MSVSRLIVSTSDFGLIGFVKISIVSSWQGHSNGLAVMKINSELGYEPVTYSELTQDENFWKGCKSCVNYDILTMKERKNCMCTAMLFDPEVVQKQYEEKMKKITHKATLLERIENAIKRRLEHVMAFEF